ncbi:MAG: hypothetical protein R3F56_04290 [Planctomycetota bacterium]
MTPLDARWASAEFLVHGRVGADLPVALSMLPLPCVQIVTAFSDGLPETGSVRAASTMTTHIVSPIPSRQALASGGQR